MSSDASEKEAAPGVANDVEVSEKPISAPANAHGSPGGPEPANLVKCMQVFAAWTLFFNTWGLLNTFGEYATYYESGHPFQASSSNIAWIGSLQSFLLLFVGLFTGPLYDAGHLRLLLIVGTFMVVFGHMMLSLVSTLWQAILTQSFLIGIGCGCLFVPSVAVISSYFSNKLPAAIGIAASGSSLGGIIYPIMFHKLLPEIGFPWTVRVIGFMALALLIIPIAVLKMRSRPAVKRKLFDFTAFREPAYTLFVFGGIFGFMGLLIPFFYISYYGIITGVVSENLGFYMLPIINSTSIFGRILPNILANKVGPLNVFVPTAAISSLLVFCLIPAKTSGGLITIAAFYGFFSGSFVSLPPSIIVSLTPPEKRGTLGTRVGMGFCVSGMGLLAGTPIAGAILGDGRDLHFTDTWIFGGTVILVGTVVFTATRFVKAGFRLEKC